MTAATPRELLPRYTCEDAAAWEGRWELIGGIPYAMTPAPSILHQRVSARILLELTQALASSDCPGCSTLLPVDWRVSEDTVLQPDNVVICHEPDKPFLTRAPVCVFEVLSPSTALKDRTLKFEIYQREGVRHLCLVDPDLTVAKVWENVSGRFVKRLDASAETVDFDLGPCVMRLDFSRLWG